MREEIVGSMGRDSYLFTLSELKGCFFCHVDLKAWSKEVYEEMLIDFTLLRESFTEDLYANIPKTNSKAQKLAGLFGFIPMRETEQTIVMRNVWEIQ